MSASPMDRCRAELGAALHVRGAVRFLHECRDQVADAAAERGEAEAVSAFGPPSAIAAAFDSEVAARRGVRSTFATVSGVLATGGSTLALTHASSPNATAPVWWTVTFFVAAQVAGVAASWRSCRRSSCDARRCRRRRSHLLARATGARSRPPD
jgi:hypothetical protein